MKMNYLWKKRGTDCRHSGEIEKMDAFHKTFQNQLGNECQPYDSMMHTSGKIDKKKQKRFRSAFTTSQIALLEKEFKKDPYVTNVRREHVANSLCLPERAVKIWFQNRRMKEKRDSCKGYDTEDLDLKSNINASDDTIEKTNPTTNQQITPTSLAAKIIFSNDIVQVTKNEDFQVTHFHVKPSHVENVAQKLHKNICEIKVEKKRVSPISTTKVETITKVPMEKLVNYSCNSKNNEVYVMEKAIPLKQTVGHVQPFTQIATEPHKSSQNVKTTTKTDDHAPHNVQSESKVPDLIPPYSSVPVDLSKYYSSVSPVPHLPWNRINFVPVMPGTQGLPYLSPQVFPTAPANMGPVQKCLCDCHLSSLEAMRAQHQMIYTPYVPHYLTHVPTPHPNAKY